MPREPRPTEVGEILTRLREALGLSTTEVAHRAGLTQSAVSRAETGRSVPTRAQIGALSDVYRPEARVRERLENLTRDARPRHRRVILHRADAPRYQAEYRDLEHLAVRIRSFTTTVVPGLLQTEDYANALVGDALTGVARERWIEERRRRRELVEDPERHLEFVVTLGMLTWNLGGAAVMNAQIDRLDEVSRLDHVRFGVITPSVVADLAVLNNVDLYERGDGRHTVVIGTSAGTSILTDHREITMHADLLDRLSVLAVHDDDARAALTDARRWYR